MKHSSLAVCIATAVVLLLVDYAAAKCELVTAGEKVEGQVTVSHPSQCFTFTKPPFTKELLMIDTATYDKREGFYICTNVSGGAEGNGCSSQLRDQDRSICISGVDGAHLITITVTCNHLNSLGCHALESGRFRMLVKWVFTPSECRNIMDFPLGSGVPPFLPSFAALLAFLLVTVLLL